MDQQLTATSRELHDKKRQLGTIAGAAQSSDDRSKYNKLYDEVAALEREVDFISDAAAALDQEIVENFRKVADLALGKNLKLFDKLLDEQAEAAK